MSKGTYCLAMTIYTYLVSINADGIFKYVCMSTGLICSILGAISYYYTIKEKRRKL